MHSESMSLACSGLRLREASPPPTADLPKVPEAFLVWLAINRGGIIKEWVNRLSDLSPSYRTRPRVELFGTVTEAFEANVDALSFGSLERMDGFIDYITKKRLEAGFPLSDVQKAFELFRVIVVERLCQSEASHLIVQVVAALNSCLAYTIHRFSDHFQHMHEQALWDHAAHLEREVNQRTAELAESERRYKTLVEEINDGYFVIQDDKIVFANQAFCRMHGAELDEVLGRPFLDFVALECRQSVLSAYQDSLRNRSRGEHLEYTRVGCAEGKGVTEVKSRVVDLGQGPLMIGICRDISARVAMEAKVREHERMAYVGHLTASLSHEIRNPLSSIKMNLQILSRKLELDGFDRRRLEITVQQVSRLEDILRQLLDTARPLHIDPAPTDLSNLAQECIELLEPKATERDICLAFRCAKRIRAVYADSGKIEEAVINLLLNAIEAVSEGGKITVWTKSTSIQGKRFGELGVRDNGPGIEPERVNLVFTPFYTSKTQGTGLGLSNVKRIMDAHKGTVEVRSRKGRGATFLLRLPCIP